MPIASSESSRGKIKRCFVSPVPDWPLETKERNDVMRTITVKISNDETLRAAENLAERDNVELSVIIEKGSSECHSVKHSVT